MRVQDVIHYLEPDKQTTVKSMVSRAGLDGEATIEQLVASYPNSNMTMDERLALVSLVYKRPNKFIAKLAFANRCEILALHRNGISREVLAAMYAIDRRTVTHIYTPNSPHYKNVRDEEAGLGRKEFERKYLSLELLDKALAYRAAQKETPNNNKLAKSKAGIHTVRGPMCTYNHRIVIQWHEPDGDIEIAGWYYKDLDGDFPDKWFCVGDESLKTSQACYNAAVEDITDKISTP